MGLHDKLAQKAVAMGKTGTDFEAAAQSHANATWVLLIAAGAVWYFVDWRWALIPAAIGAYTAPQSVSSTMLASRLGKLKSTAASGSGNDIMTIVQAYEKVLKNDAPMPGTVADASKLPYPKQQIKEALIAAIRAEPDHQTREDLKVGYITLADWQDGVGVTNRGLDLASRDQDQDTKAFAKQVVAAVESGKDWINAAQRESEALKNELEGLGLWEEPANGSV